MLRQRQLLTVLAVTILAAPVGASTWYGFGTYEPDTQYDVDGKWMRTDPDVDPLAKKIYFNAYPTEYQTSTNPNVGNENVGSRVLVPGVRQYYAMMGPWKDCNGDGYVGLAESAVHAYRNELLLDRTICPVGSYHNDGQWVWEYVPIGYQYEAAPNHHARQIVDTESRVWADFGLPGAAAATTCPIAPLPHGTTSGSGALIRYADCFAGKNIAKTVNTADPKDDLGLRFDDVNNPQQSDSHLNQHFPESLFGNPTTGETGALQLDSDEDDPDYDESNPTATKPDYAYTAWDCSDRTLEVKDPTGLAPRTVAVNDPTYNPSTGTGVLGGNYGKVDENLSDEDGNYAWFAGFAPSEVNPSGSFADGLNETFRGFRIGGGDEDWDTTVGGDCDEDGNDVDGDNTFAEYAQTAFFYPDGPHEGNTQAPAKSKADIRFTYVNSAENDGAVGQNLGTSTPNHYGVNAAGINSQRWSANNVYTTTPQAIDRGSLQPQAGLYLSFYGRIGTQTTSLGFEPAKGLSAFGVYGSEACGTETSGIVKGWQCDSTKWYTDSAGNDISQPLWDVRVHTTYQFRDIDCDDGTLSREHQIRASLVDLTAEGPCKDA